MRTLSLVRSCLAALLVTLVLSPGCSSNDKKIVVDQDITDQDGSFDAEAGEIEEVGEVAPDDLVEMDDTPQVDTEVTDTDIEVVQQPTLEVCLVTATGCLEIPETGQLALELAQHDLQPAVPGLQAAFQVTVQNVEMGTRVELLKSGALIQYREVSEETFSFDAILLSHAEAPNCPEFVVRVQDTELQTALTVCANTGGCAPQLQPSSPVCQTQDTNPALAGFQMDFLVSSVMPGCDLAWISYGQESTEPRALINGSAVIQVTLAPSASVTCQEVEVVAHVTQQAYPDREETTSAIFRLSTTQPQVDLAYPTAPVISARMDEDGEIANGINLTMEGSVFLVEPGALVELWAKAPGESQLALLDSVTSSGNAFAFPLTLETTGPYQFVVRATDCCGNMGEYSYSAVAVLDTSDLRIIAPADNATLLAKDNAAGGSPSLYALTFSVQAPTAKVGDTIELECRPNPPGSPWVEVGSVVVAQVDEDFVYSIPSLLNKLQFGSVAVCKARLASGGALALSPRITLTIGLPAPTMELLEPVTDQLVSPNNFLVVGRSLAEGWQSLSYSLKSDGQIAANGTLDVDLERAAIDGFYTLINGLSIDDGKYSLHVDGTDIFGNIASEQAGNITTVDITIDGTPAELTPLDPFAPMAICSLPSCVDSVPLRNGHQVDIRIKVTKEDRPELTRVCLTANGGESLCGNATQNGASWEAAFFGVTLIAGSNELKAEAVDGAGNNSSLTWSVSLAKEVPRVQLLTPLKDTVVLQPQITVMALVTAPGTGLPLTDAAVTLMVGGVATQAAVHAGDGVYEMQYSGLQQDIPVELQVQASHPLFPAEPGYSDIRKVTYKNQPPEIEIVKPMNGDVINWAYTSCTPGVPGCMMTVQVQTTHVEDGAEVLLLSDCLDAPLKSKVKTGTASFPKVALPDISTCTLTASVVDAAGQTATSNDVTVTIDRSPPHICEFFKPEFAILPSDWDEGPGEEGFQYTVRVRAAQLDAGQVLELKVQGPSGEEQVVSLNITTKIGNICTLYSFPSLTFEYGINTITVSTVDAAGNAAELAKAVEFSEQRTEVEFFVTSYVNPKSCTSNADCPEAGAVCAPTSGGNICMRGWRAAAQSMQVNALPVSLFAGEGGLRICSDNEGLSGEICPSSEGTFRVLKVFDAVGGYQSLEFTKSEVLALPEGEHRLMVEGWRQDTEVWQSSADSSNPLGTFRDVWIDTTAPVVGGISFPSDTQAPVGTLNSQEVGAGCTFPALIQLGEAVGGQISVWSGGVFIGQYPVAGNTFEIYLPCKQGANTVCVVVWDFVGNQTLEFCQQITVDTASPFLFFQTPNKACVAEGSSADVVVYTDAVGRVVTLSRNQGGNFVELNGKTAAGNGLATFAGTMASDGSYELMATVTDTAGNMATAITQPPTVTVDRTPPAVDIMQPAQGASLTPTDDAAPTKGGFQVLLLLNTSDVTEYDISTVRCTDATYSNCEDPVKVTPVSVIDAGNGQLSITVTISKMLLPIEYRRIVATVKDSCGNTRQDQVDIQIAAGGCTVSFPEWPDNGYWNNELCLVPGSDCDFADVPVKVAFFGPCGDITGVELLLDGNSFGTEAPEADGTALFLVNLPHATIANVEAKLVANTGPTLFTTGSYGAETDFVAPQVGFTTPSEAPFVCNMAVDTNQLTAGCQTEVAAQISDDNLAGGTYRLQQTGLSPTNLASGTATQAIEMPILSVSLAEVDPSSMLLSAWDAAGNLGELSVPLTVDVTPPSEVFLYEVDPVADINRRLPAVTLRWSAPGDDHSTGTAAEYLVKYSLNPIVSQEDFDAACDISPLLETIAPADPKEAGGTEAFTIAGPDIRLPGDPCLWRVRTAPGAKYYFAVQARDDAGNASPMSVDSSTVTDALTLKFMRIDRGTAGSVGTGSIVFAPGDIDGDGFDEVIIGGDPAFRGFCVVKGSGELPSELALSDAPSNVVQCVFDGYNSGLGREGCAVGDVNGDGFRDFVSRVDYDSNGDIITSFRLYLGNAQGFLDSTAAATFLIEEGEFVSDSCAALGNLTGDLLPSGEPLNDFALTAGWRNKVYLVQGNTLFSSAAPVTIDLRQESQRTEWNVATLSNPTAGEWDSFGFNVANTGNVLPDEAGDSLDDFMVSQWGPPGAVFVFPGRNWTGAALFTVSPTLDGSGTEDAVALKLLSKNPAACTDGMGAELLGSKDLDGDGTPDLAMTHPCWTVNYSDQSHYVFWGDLLAAQQGAVVNLGTSTYNKFGVRVFPGGYRIVSNTWSFGALANFDGSTNSFDQGHDLLFGVFNGLGSVYGKIFVKFHTGQERDANVIWTAADLTITDPFTPDSDAFARRVVSAGDINGDGLPDILAATEDLGYAVLVY